MSVGHLVYWSSAPADRVVARLAYPMPVGSLSDLIRAIEAVYGPGLLVDYGHPEASEWMIITRPEADQ